ncbi:MAG: hypothetical protein PHW75_01565 [Patescibacteria group bacterium]|nr:hypothetical protein [Patescibacteria group bacterium]
MESRREKFRRLANIRVNNALKQIGLIGNLSNKSSYEYTDDDIRKIFAELEGALKASKMKYKISKKRSFKI